MLPLDINPSVKNAIAALEAYQKGAAPNVDDISTKVNEFVNEYGKAIQESDQKNITALLGRLSSQSSSQTGVCEELTALITSVALSIHKKDSELGEKEMIARRTKRLEEAGVLFSSILQNPQQIEKFVSMTYENERLEIIKGQIRCEYNEKVLSEWVVHFSENIDRYKFSEAESADLVLWLANYDAVTIVNNIKKFHITDQENLKEIAFAIARYKGRLLSERIQDFNIKDEKDRLEIAKHAAWTGRLGRFGIAKYISNYNLNKEENRYEVAAIEAKEDHWYSIEEGENQWQRLKQYNITSEKYRFALAEISSKYSPLFSKHIKAYGITEESDRLKLALNAAAVGDGNIHEDIDNYELSSEENRTAVAKAEANNHRNDKISQNIGCFKLVQESNRCEVAKIAAKWGRVWNGEDIKYYQLNEPYRAEVAAVAAKCNAGRTAKEIQSYGITNEKMRAAIAKVIAERQPSDLICFLENFKITDQAVRLDIINTALANARNLQWIEENARHCNATDRVVIAKYLASRYDRFRIASYNIVDESDRIAIAKIYFHSQSSKYIYVFQDFHIEDKRAILDLCLLVMKKKPKRGEHVDYREEIFKWFRDNSPLVKSSASPSQEALGKEAKNIASGDPEVYDNILLPWLLNYEWACNYAQLSEEVRKEQSPYAIQILKYQDPAMRHALMAVLFQYGFPKKPEGGDHLLLFDMVLTPLLKDSGLTIQDRDQIGSILKRKDYYDSTKKEKALKGLTSLLQCEKLNAKDKGALLKHIFGKAEAQKKDGARKTEAFTDLQMLDAIISSDNVSVLKIQAQADKKEENEKDKKAAAEDSPLKQPIDLEAAVNQIFTQVIGIESLEEFSTKYAGTIGAGRDPLAFLIYGAQLGSLPHNDFEKASNTLKEFVTVVLNGKEAYKAWRYQTPENSHLEQIFKDRAKLKENWMAGECLSIGDLQKKTAEENLKLLATAKSAYSTFDPVHYLKLRIIDDKHIPNVKESFPRLEECLNNPNKCKEALIALSQERKKDKLSKTEKFDATNEKTKPMFLRQLEVVLINLLVSTTPANKKVSDITDFVLPQLIAIYGANSQIVRDIETLQKHLQTGAQSETKANIEKKYLIEDTDNWEDMLLSGTEVSGSCQRISGSPDLNKCLLAYLADGKNRAIVVKDPKTGKIDPKTGQIDPKTCKIVARRIMRLLWDPESNQPVLFQERLYNNPGVPPEALQAIDLMFARRAKQLGIPLVRTAIDTKEANYPHAVESLGSPAPFEYVDAGAGVTHGIFTLPANTIFRVQI